MPPPRKQTFTISSVQKLHAAGMKLQQSATERNKFANDPVRYLSAAGFKVPTELVTELRTSAFRINEVLTGKHNPVAAIAVA